ncbi:MAG: Photosynthesis system assembly factor, partial [Frankiaceae bacterium]|nr:Photosynthesis system assembly factor [Frankiaceae bacterium]
APATMTTRMFRTSDGGANWTALDNAPAIDRITPTGPDAAVALVTLTPGRPSDPGCSGYVDENSQACAGTFGVVRTTDGGATWTSGAPATGLP